MNYEKLAEGLAFQMAACVRSGDAGEFCAPFELVIIDPRGAVLFDRRSHFPATALLTDRSLVTRTFQIDRASC
ncbi:MAG: hypothetical protein DMG39_28300 [Acidobacteria bacterium]|nr:MAG: hypothetical protein DMG39_28300 [Acidobacteriota bacterium]